MDFFEILRGFGEHQGNMHGGGNCGQHPFPSSEDVFRPGSLKISILEKVCKLEVNASRTKKPDHFEITASMTVSANAVASSASDASILFLKMPNPDSLNTYVSGNTSIPLWFSKFTTCSVRSSPL